MCRIFLLALLVTPTILTACQRPASGLAERRVCADGVTEVAADDATATGFSAEEAWSFLEGDARRLHLLLDVSDVGGVEGDHSGDLSLTRREGAVFFVEDWGVTPYECKDSPMLRVPVTLAFASADGLLHVDAPITLDVQALALESTWFSEGNSGPLSLVDAAPLDQAFTTAYPEKATPSELVMNLWSTLDAGDAALSAVVPREADGVVEYDSFTFAAGDWTLEQ